MLILFLPAKAMEQQHKEKELRCNAAVWEFIPLLGKSLVHHLLVHSDYIPDKEKTMKQQTIRTAAACCCVRICCKTAL
jgi:hypothetical protein